MDTVTNLRTFIAVVHYESFAEAARQIHVVPSVVAKRIAQLEKTMGAKLFIRSTRTVKITDAGMRLYAKARQVLDQFDDLVEDVQRDSGKLEGHIRLMLPTTLSMMYLDQVVADFIARNDRITLEVVLADRTVSPLENGFDIMVSGRTAHYDGVAQIPLAPIQVVMCASKEYLANHPTITHPSDLADHACLVFSPQGAAWSFETPKGVVYVDVQAKMTADDNKTLCLAAMNGSGVAQLPYYSAEKALKDGQLVSLLENFPPPERWYRAYVPRRKLGHARINTLAECIRDALQNLPHPPKNLT